MKKYRTAIILFAVFEIIAVSLWLATGNLFFLLNFTYIGTCLGVGGVLVAAGKKYAREFVQFGVGAYMLVFLGLICKENMQIEGFWYYLLSGVFCITPSPKYSDRYSSAGAGAATPAGRP